MKHDAFLRVITCKGLWRHVLPILLLLPLLCSCSYLKYASVQAEYARIQQAEPGQVNLKHMLDRDTHFVLGRTLDPSGRHNDLPMAIAAYSSRFKPHERVDTMFFTGVGTHYGLNLPDGEFDLLVYSDHNANGTFDSGEVVGRKHIILNRQTSPDKVRDGVDFALTEPSRVAWAEAIPRPDDTELQASLFYPTGSIRSLDDPIFAENMATLGMYDPASFLERAPTMFYALEEDAGHKIPVVFVHGIGGTPRNFTSIIDRLDRTRYKPWFFYYPSGGDLDQFAEFFYRIFLAGKVVRQGPMPMIIVAHSMGGLVVREALNRYHDSPDENHVSLLATIATPFGGHPSAATGEKHGLIVLPSWRDVNPQSRFIQELFRNPLPESLNVQLLYAFDNPDALKLSKNSDGVVPLASQLRPEAQRQSRQQFGFDSSHTGILQDPKMIDYLFARIATVKSYFPEDHLAQFDLGGFDVPLSDGYEPFTRYVIRIMGRYLVALGKGEIEPIDAEQERFVRVVQGEGEAKNQVEEGWLRFLREHPEIR